MVWRWLGDDVFDVERCWCVDFHEVADRVSNTSVFLLRVQIAGNLNCVYLIHLDFYQNLKTTWLVGRGIKIDELQRVYMEYIRSASGDWHTHSIYFVDETLLPLLWCLLLLALEASNVPISSFIVVSLFMVSFGVRLFIFDEAVAAFPGSRYFWSGNYFLLFCSVACLVWLGWFVFKVPQSTLPCFRLACFGFRNQQRCSQRLMACFHFDLEKTKKKDGSRNCEHGSHTLI